MRRQRERAAAVEPAAEWSGARQQEPARAPLRQVQWSSYYHRFFGRVRPGDRVPSGVQPLSLDESAQTLHDVYCTADATSQKKRRHVARRCVSQMLIYGYRPAEAVKPTFDKLVTTAARPESGERAIDERKLAADARDFLLRWGVRQFTPEQWSPVRRNQELIRAAGNSEKIVARPTELMHDHGAFVVTKQVYLNARVDQVSHLINPENWERLGEFFARTFREGGPEDSLATAKPDPWQGVLREDFICSWNGFTTNIFKQRLKVDYSVAPSIARTDYALMYEEDDQIVVNDGFFEVKSHDVPGVQADDPPLPPGWIVGTMRKRLKFTSSVLNLLCPALLPMFLDSQASGFNKFFDE
ncbi:MAG: hypothetical protein ACRERC_20365 [Candidatus Binatia bacterium]